MKATDLVLSQLCKVGTLLSLFLIVHILRRLWVLDTVEDKGLKVVGSNCPLIEELYVFPSSSDGDDVVDGVTKSGFIAVSNGCPRLHYVLYFC
ncbi:hypothetical protein ACFX19_044004 [Malus domestica]